jgi:hypothetical protein
MAHLRIRSVLPVLALALTAPAFGMSLSSGVWEMGARSLDHAIPGGLSAAEQAKMLQGLPVKTTRDCLTPELIVKRPVPVLNVSDECRYEGLKTEGGKIRGTMLCRLPGGGESASTLNGDWTATTLRMTLAQPKSKANPGSLIAVTARWVKPC